MFRLIPALLLSASLFTGAATAAPAPDERATTMPHAARVLGLSGDEGLFVGRRPSPVLIDAIAGWLAKNFELPASDAAPRIAFAPAQKIAALRYGGFSGAGGAPESGREVVAVYDDLSGTIYLADTWTGRTPAELSVLVHEMAHHLQKAGGLRYACAGAREKIAYAAQEKWLGLFGLDLATTFDVDPFTLLAMTACMH